MRPFTPFVRPLTAAALTAAAGLASAAHAAEPIGETGRITLGDTVDSGVSETVTLRNSYTDPVVVAFINTRNGDQSVQVRVSDVTGSSFVIFMEEPDGQGHNPESVSYVVMERGSHFLADGRKVEAGSVDTATTHRGASGFAGDGVSFSAGFDGAPAVLHGLNSYANGDFMASMATAVDADGFEIGLEAAETGAAAAVETVAWIAFEPGEGTLDGSPYFIGAGADGSNDGVGQGPHAIAFAGFDAAPDVIASVLGTHGVDGAWARGAGQFDAGGQTVYAEEDQIRDSERGHADEPIAYVAFAADTDLVAAEGHLKWRLRNAADPSSGGNWAIRDLAFCADAACADPLSGVAFDSGNAFDWAPVDDAFDGDAGTFWKTHGVDPGNTYIGLELDRPAVVQGIDLDADNVVYTPGAYYVEYYDADAAAWVVADYLMGAGDLDAAVSLRERFPTAWRLRNAVESHNGSNWALRELTFCADAACAEGLSGAAFDSGHAFDWAPVENAFDGDTGTFWKTTGSAAGEVYIGQSFDAVTEVGGLYLRTDNIVYTVDEVLVEYYDAVAEAWVTADYLTGFDGSADDTRAVTVRDRFPVSWRLRNAVESHNGSNWALRELTFCADAACAEGLSGEAFDSGHAFDWAPVEQAFDGDSGTFWKTTGSAAGEVYLGQDFAGVTEVGGLYLRTDNIVYTVDEVLVEYYDIVSGGWVTAASLAGFAGSADHTIGLD